MKTKHRITKARLNFYIDIVSLLPFFLLLITGLILLMYHSGRPYTETILQFEQSNWLNFHKILSIVSSTLIIIHLVAHTKWLKQLFTAKLKGKKNISNLLLLITFVLTALLAFIPWFFIKNANVSAELLGIHNKVGLLLLLFFIIHLSNYYKWIIKMIKK